MVRARGWNGAEVERGWKYFKHVLDSRSGYPEVSFTVISQVATRIMGIEPDASVHSLATLGRLPKEVEWLELDHVPVGSNDLLVRHADGNRSTTVANHAGHDLTWEALFRGRHSTIKVDGLPMSARVMAVNGVEVSGVTVTVKAGQRRIAIVADKPQG